MTPTSPTTPTAAGFIPADELTALDPAAHPWPFSELLTRLLALDRADNAHHRAQVSGIVADRLEAELVLDQARADVHEFNSFLGDFFQLLFRHALRHCPGAVDALVEDVPFVRQLRADVDDLARAFAAWEVRHGSGATT